MFKHLSLLLASSSIAVAATQFQNLTELLSNIPEISQFYGAVIRDPTVLVDFALAKNVTLFATSNAAFLPTVGPQSGFLSVADSVHAGLQYSIVDGILHSADFTTTGTFMHSHLTNLSWSSVSGGQVLEVIEVVSDKGAENASVGVTNGTQGMVYAADRVSVNITTAVSLTPSCNILSDITRISNSTTVLATSKASSILSTDTFIHPEI
jgi:hypothetical protein